MTGMRQAVAPGSVRLARRPGLLPSRDRQALGHGSAAARHETVTVASKFSRSRPSAPVRTA